MLPHPRRRALCALAALFCTCAINHAQPGDPAYNNDAIIDPYSNWRGPVWINANFLDWLILRRYGFRAEAHTLALNLAAMLHRDIAQWGSMREDYDAETGAGLAPTPAQSPNGKFAGFVGWNLLAQDMLQCETARGPCLSLALDRADRYER